MIEREKIIRSYLFLLGRHPESENITSSYTKLKNEKQVIETIINSSEYKKNKSKKIRILVLGNCQGYGIATAIQAMAEETRTLHILLTESKANEILSECSGFYEQLKEADLILIQPYIPQLIKEKVLAIPELARKIRYFPAINFSAFHPDACYVFNNSNQFIRTPLGDYNSALVYFSWRNGLSTKEIIKLFNIETFRRLGYLNQLDLSVKILEEQESITKLPLSKMLKKWLSHGCFMHSINHPKLFVLADIARLILKHEGISHKPEVENYLEDFLAKDNCWPIYPGIAEQFGLIGHYSFKKASPRYDGTESIPTITLEHFVEGSIKEYSKYAPTETKCPQVESARYKNLKNYLDAQKNIPPSKNPYKNLLDYQFWRRAIEAPSMSEVDPVVQSKFKLSREHKIATAGSCFAQHISRTLQKNGFHYYVVENNENLSAEEAEHKNYGIFSARYGNLYTARQLLQLFDQAYESFTPAETAWLREDGRYVDPFRPQIEPNGFDSIDAVIASRKEHLKNVRTMFENLDIFIFTLGLTESWRSKVDGAIYPLAPGVVAGSMDHEKYEFINFEIDEIIKDMQDFIDRLHQANPQAKIILTVSPVPLIATYEKRHVLVSTTYSKSALRAAADALVRRNTTCEYFPSYEIITGNFTHGSYFESDLRSIKPEGVNHVMKLFIKHYSIQQTESIDKAQKENPISELEAQLRHEHSILSKVICDEEALVQ